MAIYRIRELSFTFPGQSQPALSEIELNVMTGQFVVLCGRSGSGKSTLLRQLKPALTPHGERSGEILYAGAPLASLETRRQAAEIGFVLQHADNSVVTDKVWHELAFGLESLGEDQQTIRLRVAEMASFFGIQSWFHRSVSELSGGQRQLLQLASIMAMQPQVLLLDEPTSQLDPIAALDFLNTLTRINRELGTTILLSEHRLEEALPLADRLLVMDAGRLVADGPSLEAAGELRRLDHPMFQAMPSAIRIHAGTASRLPAPLTVRDGRSWLFAHLAEEQSGSEDAASTTPLGGQTPSGVPASATRLGGPEPSDAPAVATLSGGHRPSDDIAAVDASSTVSTTAVATPSDGRAPGIDAAALAEPGRRASGRVATAEPALRLRDVWYRYDKQGPDILRGFDLEVAQGEWCCILGGNGAGKSTALALAGGLLRPQQGQVRALGIDPARGGGPAGRGLAILPQQPQTLFVHKTVALELADMLRGGKLDEPTRQAKLDAVIALTELGPLLERHPYDLSGGEQQRAALAKVLLLEPRILLLDEPTKGLDGFYKEQLAALLHRLQADGVTIVMVSHDIEFCASYGETCALVFDGAVISQGPAHSFFAGNSFYTTAANRLARELWRDAVTVDDVIGRCRQELR